MRFESWLPGLLILMLLATTTPLRASTNGPDLCAGLLEPQTSAGKAIEAPELGVLENAYGRIIEAMLHLVGAEAFSRMFGEGALFPEQIEGPSHSVHLEKALQNLGDHIANLPTGEKAAIEKRLARVLIEKLGKEERAERETTEVREARAAPQPFRTKLAELPDNVESGSYLRILATKTRLFFVSTGAVFLADPTTGEIIRRLPGVNQSQEKIVSAILSQDGEHLIAETIESKVLIWNTRNLDAPRQIQLLGTQRLNLATSPGGGIFAFDIHPAIARVFDLSEPVSAWQATLARIGLRQAVPPRELVNLPERGYAESIAYQPEEGGFILYLSHGVRALWKPGGRKVHVYDNPSQGVEGFRGSIDGKLVVELERNRAVVREAGSRVLMTEMPLPGSDALFQRRVEFSPDSKIVAVVGQQNITLKALAGPGADLPAATYWLNADRIDAVGFVPGQKALFVLTSDRTLERWNLTELLGD